MTELDPIDRHIIAELRSNARIPLTTLAARVGRSRTAIQVRLERLERDGIIQGYHAKLAGDGEKTLRVGAILTIHLKDRLSPHRVIGLLKGMQEVIGIYTVTGDADLVVTLEVTNREHLQNIFEPVWELAEVRDTDTRLVLKSHLDR